MKLNNKKIPSIKVTPQNKVWDSTYQMLSWWKSERVQSAKIMVVGAGALGNEVLKNLTLLNVGQILIVDFDHIEYSNLSRSILFREKDAEAKSFKSSIAANRIKEINSNVKVKTINGDITIDVGLGVFRRMDVIIGCLDNRLARLFLNRACYKVNKVWIDGAIENLIGQVNVYLPNVTCYECGLNKTDWKNIHFRLGCADIAKRNYSQGRIPTTPISSSIVAAIQAQEALKVVNGNDEKLMTESFYYEGMNNLVLQLKPSPLKEFCFSHYTYEEIIESPLSAENTITEALAWLKVHFDCEEPMIKLDNEIALRIVTRQSEKAYDVLIPKLYLTNKEIEKYQEIADEEIVITDETNEIDGSFDFQNKTLKEIGIPHLHIIQVYAHEVFHNVELTGDEAFLSFD